MTDIYIYFHTRYLYNDIFRYLTCDLTISQSVISLASSLPPEAWPQVFWVFTATFTLVEPTKPG